MKVVIPVETDTNILCVTFGRAPYFLIYDTQTDTQGLHRNPAASAQGGAGLKAAQFVVDSKAQALITARLGGNSSEVLKAAGIQIYKSEGLTVKQNIAALKEGRLSVMENFSSGFRGGRSL